jgi:hypothetical protein
MSRRCHLCAGLGLKLSILFGQDCVSLFFDLSPCISLDAIGACPRLGQDLFGRSLRADA